MQSNYQMKLQGTLYKFCNKFYKSGSKPIKSKWNETANLREQCHSTACTVRRLMHGISYTQDKATWLWYQWVQRPIPSRLKFKHLLEHYHGTLWRTAAHQLHPGMSISARVSMYIFGGKRLIFFFVNLHFSMRPPYFLMASQRLPIYDFNLAASAERHPCHTSKHSHWEAVLQRLLDSWHKFPVQGFVSAIATKAYDTVFHPATFCNIPRIMKLEASGGKFSSHKPAFRLHLKTCWL